MKRKDITGLIQARTDLSLVQAQMLTDEIINAAVDALACGEEITLRGFGMISVVQRKGKTGRDFAHGGRIDIPARKGIRFKPGHALLLRINEGREA